MLSHNTELLNKTSFISHLIKSSTIVFPTSAPLTHLAPLNELTEEDTDTASYILRILPQTI